MLIRQQQLAVNKNPYIDAPYFESRLHREAIRHVNSTYRPIWERQEGRCLYCGNKILPDQDRTLVQIDLRATPSLKNSAYIHKFCETHEFDFLGTMDDPQEPRPFQIMGMLMELARIEEDQPLNRKQKPNLPRSQQWNHYPAETIFCVKRVTPYNANFCRDRKNRRTQVTPCVLE